MGTKWNTGSFLWRSGNTFSLGGWLSTGTQIVQRGCGFSLLVGHLEMVLGNCLICEVGLDWPPGVFSNLNHMRFLSPGVKLNFSRIIVNWKVDSSGNIFWVECNHSHVCPLHSFLLFRFVHVLLMFLYSWCVSSRGGGASYGVALSEVILTSSSSASGLTSDQSIII